MFRSVVIENDTLSTMFLQLRHTCSFNCKFKIWACLFAWGKEWSEVKGLQVKRKEKKRGSKTQNKSTKSQKALEPWESSLLFILVKRRGAFVSFSTSILATSSFLFYWLYPLLHSTPPLMQTNTPFSDCFFFNFGRDLEFMK